MTAIPSSSMVHGPWSMVLRRYLPALAVFLAVTVLWEALVRVLNIQRFLLPAPSRILSTFSELYPNLFARGWYTFQEALIGFCIGSGAGILVAMATARWKSVSQAMLPFAIAANSVPIIALSPLATIWFGIDQGSKIAIVAIMTFFPAMISTTRGLRSASPAAIDLMRSYAASELDIFRKLRLPTALPFVFSALKISTTLSMIGAVVAEYFSGSVTKQLGVYIKSEANISHFENAWSAIIVASLFGIGFYLVIALIERLAMPWHVQFRRDDGR